MWLWNVRMGNARMGNVRYVDTLFWLYQVGNFLTQKLIYWTKPIGQSPIYKDQFNLSKVGLDKQVRGQFICRCSLHLLLSFSLRS